MPKKDRYNPYQFKPKAGFKPAFNDLSNSTYSSDYAPMMFKNNDEVNIHNDLKNLILSKQKEDFKWFTNAGAMASDVAVLGNYIPHPIAQGVGKAGIYGSLMFNGMQSINSLSDGDYMGAGLNAAAAVLPMGLGKFGYLRSGENVANNSVFRKFITKPSGMYRPLAPLPNRIAPSVIKGLNYNKSILGTDLAAIGYNSFNNGGNNDEWEVIDDAKLKFRNGGGDNFYNRLLQGSKPITDKGNFSNISYTAPQQKILTNVRLKEKQIAQKQLEDEKRARAVKEKNQPYVFPDGKSKTWEQMSDHEKGFINGQSLRNKGRWNENEVEQPFLNMFNPGTMLYDLAAGIGEAGYLSKQQNSILPYVTGVGAPLAVGTLAGMGSKTTGQFINNLANPLAGTGQIIDNIGNKYLPNAYKLNPYAFKPNSESYYRGIGKTGLDDALESNVLRGPKNGFPGVRLTDNFELAEGFSQNYLPSKMVSNGDGTYAMMDDIAPKGFDGKRYIAEIPKNKLQDAIPYTLGDSPYAVKVKNSIPIDNVKFYKEDWLKGYKEIPKPKTNFKSEIDWVKWNKEIPENTQLMNEYNTIEQTSKANNTWMKNPDGSSFQGTPEQFVQQNSENFKKAFPEYYGEMLNHNTPNKFKVFSEEKFGSNSDDGWYGKGVYAHPDKNYTKVYGENNLELYVNSPNKGKINIENLDAAKNYNRDLIEEAKKIRRDRNNRIKEIKDNIEEFNDQDFFVSLINSTADSKLETLKRNQWLKKYHKIDEYTTLTNPHNGEVVIPFSNRVKSAIGNNGMFDMTNPNIYKALVPAAIGAGALQKKQNGGGDEWEII